MAWVGGTGPFKRGRILFRFHLKRKGDPVRLELFFNNRLVPALPVPDGKDIGKTASGMGADADEVKHSKHRPVSRVGNPPAFRGVDFNSKASRIGKGNGFPPLDNDNAFAAVIIGVDETVRERFPKRLAHRRVVGATGIWRMDVSGKAAVNPCIKIIDISAPISRGGKNSRFFGCKIILFPIIEKIMGEFLSDVFFGAKHQKPGGCRMERFVRAFGGSADAKEKVAVRGCGLQNFPEKKGRAVPGKTQCFPGVKPLNPSLREEGCPGSGRRRPGP